MDRIIAISWSPATRRVAYDAGREVTMTARLFACALVFLLPACEQPSPQLTEAEVQDFVRQYVAASNAADATKIMSFIQKDEAVSSAGLGVIHRGWNAIRTATDDAIQQNVRIKTTVGTMDVTRVANDTALAVARMSVSTNQPVKTASGYVMSAPGAMTIVVKRGPEGLRIIHEHYSLQTL